MIRNPLAEYDVDELADQVQFLVDTRFAQFRERFGVARWLGWVADLASVAIGAALVAWNPHIAVAAFGGVAAAAGVLGIAARVVR